MQLTENKKPLNHLNFINHSKPSISHLPKNKKHCLKIRAVLFGNKSILPHGREQPKQSHPEQRKTSQDGGGDTHHEIKAVHKNAESDRACAHLGRLVVFERFLLNSCVVH